VRWLRPVANGGVERVLHPDAIAARTTPEAARERLQIAARERAEPTRGVAG